MKTISCESPEDFHCTGYSFATRQILARLKRQLDGNVPLPARMTNVKSVERADDPRLIRDVRVAFANATVQRFEGGFLSLR